MQGRATGPHVLDQRSAEEFAALHRLTFRTSPRAWTAKEFLALAHGGRNGLFSSRLSESSELVGLAVARIAANEAEMLTIATARAHRRQGIGRELLSALTEWARDQGASVLYLEVAANNIPAISLYELAGLHPVGRRPGYYRDKSNRNLDAIILSGAIT